MKYNPEKHHRHSIRLKYYDYSQPGAYFITICTHNRVCLLGKIKNGQMILNKFGMIAKQCWLDIPSHYPNVKLDEFVIMPNHIHGIIVIKNVGVQNIEPNKNIVGVQNIEPQHNIEPLQNKYQKIIPCSIGSIVRGYKIGVTKWFLQNTNIVNVWQRNYYEHIIRNEREFNKIREYIINNPLKWELDIENPQRQKEYKDTKNYFKEVLK